MGHMTRTMIHEAMRPLLTILVAVTLGACYEHTYVIGAGAPAGTVVYSQWRHHWLAGLISPDHEMAIRDVCPSGNATVHQEQTFLNGLVGALTAGIYVPRTVEVRCAGGRAVLELDEREVASIVWDAAFSDRVGAVLPELLGTVVEARDALKVR